MKEDLLYIEHILGCINNILDYTKGLTVNDFSENQMIQDAVIRNFEIIGEASKKVSVQFKETYSEVPWRAMSGMRDKLIHDYIGVDAIVIWKTIEEDLPFLKELLEKDII